MDAYGEKIEINWVKIWEGMGEVMFVQSEVVTVWLQCIGTAVKNLDGVFTLIWLRQCNFWRGINLK